MLILQLAVHNALCVTNANSLICVAPLQSDTSPVPFISLYSNKHNLICGGFLLSDLFYAILCRDVTDSESASKSDGIRHFFEI